MISAPNLRPRLSGNKLLLFLGYFGVLCLSGCKSLQPAAHGQGKDTQPENKREEGKLDEIPATKQYDPVTRQWVVVPPPPSERMDTFVFKTVKPYYATAVTFIPNFFPPDPRALEGLLKEKKPVPEPVSPNTPRIEKKDQYKIMVALPFSANEIENAQEVTQGRVGRWAINFYGGIQLAAKEMETDGVKLNVYVRDTKSDDSGIPALLSSPDARNTDVFIGPYRREHIRTVADQAKKENFVMFSPHSAVTNLVQGNPNFVQVNPSLEQHCRALLRHVRSEFSEEEILILYRANQPAEKTCAEYFQNANAGLQGAREPELIPELVLENSTYGGINISQLIKGRPRIAIMVPSWAEQNFILMLLRRIIEAKSDDQMVVVYGMPQWIEFQNFEYDYFEKLQVRISSNSFIDLKDPAVKAFRQRYLAEFGAMPEPAAYEGYGLFRFIGKMLKEYGKYFQYYMDVNPTTGLHTRYEFQSILEPQGNYRADLLNAIGRFENIYLNILEFREFHFQLMR